MAKSKKSTKPYWVETTENRLEIHLAGEILTNTVFLNIVELMKRNRESNQPKAVRFWVEGSTMLMSVRYAFPSAYYESVELEKQAQVVSLERLQNAANL